MIPVILTHIGLQDYVGVAIEQAKRHNDRVVLIGDHARWPVEFYQSEDYWEGASEFAKVYHHMSGNPYGQELYCFQIYFMLRDWCRAHDIERVFTMDSDVMLYTNVTEYEKTLGDYDLAINWCERQEPYRWSACLHNSFWKLETLEDMCDCIIEGYSGSPLTYRLQEKWEWHQDNDVPGGVCDMTLLHFFRQGRRAVNLSRVRDGKVWDDNINQAENYEEDEYEMENGHKRLWLYESWDDSRPILAQITSGQREKVFANALHFQGQAKGLMEEYAT